MKKFTLLLCAVTSATIGFAAPETLTLEQALTLARANSPKLRASQLNAQSASAATLAAGKWANPELEFEAEGLGGDLDPYQDGEYSVGISQRFQRGGTLQNERTLAQKGVTIAEHEIDEQNRELTQHVQEAFIELMVQQETGVVRAELEQLGRAFLHVAQRRHKAGGASELDVLQAELALDEILLAQTCCFGDLASAKETFASLIGTTPDALPTLSSPFYELGSVDGLSIDNSHPTLQRLQAEADRAATRAKLAKASDSSSFKLGAGFKHEAAENIDTFILSASVPLNFHKKGRAQAAAATLRADAILAERMETERQLKSELASLLAEYDGSVAEINLIKNNLIPKAIHVYEVSRKGYDNGRFSWFELISAQSQLAEIRIRHIEALRDAHLTRAKISTFITTGNE